MIANGTLEESILVSSGAVDTLDTLDTHYTATPLTARGACHELRGPVRSYRSTSSRGCFSFARRCRGLLRRCRESRGASFTTASRDPPRVSLSLCCAGISAPVTNRTRTNSRVPRGAVGLDIILLGHRPPKSLPPRRASGSALRLWKRNLSHYSIERYAFCYSVVLMRGHGRINGNGVGHVFGLCTKAVLE